MNAAELKDLSKKHGRHRALDQLTVTIAENKLTGLIGRNGAGKTTLMKLLAGFWRPTSGDIRVLSRRPFNDLLVSANTILIDDDMDLPTALTLKEILQEAGRFYENWDGELADRLFEYFSFQSNQNYASLSKGEKSTFNMIVGLCSRCALTMFDEPTSGMDAAVRKDFYRALLKDYLAHPRSIIVSSHHLDEIEELLEDVILLEEGQNYLHMPVEKLKEYAVSLSGSSEAVTSWTQSREVLYAKETELGKYTVVKNDFSEEELASMREDGIQAGAVSPGDVCVYLTGSAKGEIDDVFNKA